MANEAEKIELINSTGFPLQYTCAAGTDIAKGTLLKFSDPRTVAISDGAEDLFAGVAAMDKDSSDDSTTISVWTNGVFEFAASGSITAGDRVETSSSDDNKVQTSTTTDFSKLVGYALDTASDNKVAVRMIR